MVGFDNPERIEETPVVSLHSHVGKSLTSDMACSIGQSHLNMLAKASEDITCGKQPSEDSCSNVFQDMLLNLHDSNRCRGCMSCM